MPTPRLRSPYGLASALALLAGACFNPEGAEPPADQDADASEASSADDASPGSDDGDGESGGPSSSSGEDPAEQSDCGDGIVQGGEECDLGSDNRDDGPCTSACTIAICGDGFVHAGAEECDAAGIAANCDPDCTNPVCGDGIMNPLALEQCDGDDGLSNSTCQACVVVCDPGWSRCGGGPAAQCATRIESAASCTACGHRWQVHETVATETLSLNETDGTPGSIALLESAHMATGRIVGWMGFDLDPDDEPIMVEEARLRLHVVTADGTAAVEVVADHSPAWSGMDSSGDEVVSERHHAFVLGSAIVELDPDRWDWRSAFADGWANLGLDPQGPPESWLSMEATQIQSLAPVLEVEGCMP